MVNINKIYKIGYGSGFGGTFATTSEYTIDHTKTINFFCKQSKGNFIDTSLSYGKGKSERIIGKLNQKTKKKIFISTKVSAKDLSYKNFIKSVMKSLKNLKVKKIDLIQPHWPNYKLHNNEIVKAFNYLKRRGKVKYFGLSNYDLKDVEFFKKKLKDNFKFIQEEYSLRDRELEKNIKYYERKNFKIICYSPLGTGGLNFNEKENKLLSYLSKKYDQSFHSIMLNFLSSKSKNLILIPHTKQIKHLQDNLRSMEYKIEKNDLKKLDLCFKTNYIKLKLKDIIFYDKKYSKMRSLNDAIKNKGRLNPSPKILAKKLKEGHKVKHIKLKKIQNKYYIKEGRLRYWAHVIAFGWEKKLEMIIT